MSTFTPGRRFIAAKLIEKLHNNNINCNMIKWIATFLENRIMEVKVKAEFSDSDAVLSGVPKAQS